MREPFLECSHGHSAFEPMLPPLHHLPSGSRPQPLVLQSMPIRKAEFGVWLAWLSGTQLLLSFSLRSTVLDILPPLAQFPNILFPNWLSAGSGASELSLHPLGSHLLIRFSPLLNGRPGGGGKGLFWLECDKAQVVLPAASSLVLVGRPPTLGLFTVLSVVVEEEGAGRDSRSLMLLFNISSCLRLALSPELFFRRIFLLLFRTPHPPPLCNVPSPETEIWREQP